MRIINFPVEDNMDGKTVLQILFHNNVSRRLVTKLKQVENGITVNGLHVRTIDTVCKNDIVSIMLKDEKVLEKSQHLNVPIAYEDDDIIIFDKPAFMPVHPSHKHQGDTLGNFFAWHCSGLTFRPINRLDKDTSGLCAVAKNRFSAQNLQKSLEKTYFAIVQGNIKGEGTISKPISRVDNSIIKRCVSPNGQEAVTHYKAISSSDIFSYIEIKLETGRTHQIRVHFSYEGHPLAGDDMYGGSLELINRQALHCGELIFVHPVTCKEICVKSELPSDMKNLLLYI